MMFVFVLELSYVPPERAPSAPAGGASLTVTTPAASGPSATAWTSNASSRGWPSSTSWSASSTARNSESTAPLPSADACQRWSPLSSTTAPRLRELEPVVQVQRARRMRWSGPPWPPAVAASVGSVVMRGLLVAFGRGRGAPGLGAGRRPAGEVPFVAPQQLRADFQMAYSSESASAFAEAAMMFVSEPIVDHSFAPSAESMITRVRAAVAASPSRMRTL